MTSEQHDRNQAIQKATDDIESVVAQCNVMALREKPALLQAIELAQGVAKLREILPKGIVERYFMPLQGSKLGFVTDKDTSGGYTWEVVREVLIEALLRGFRPVGNELNIIAGQFYGAKNGFERIVREWPGLTNLRIDLGVPHLVADKGALVPCEARWRLDGKAMSVECKPPSGEEFDTRIPVKVNGGMGPDAILGKATRKLYARVYQVLTGCASDIVDAEGETVTVPGQSLPAPAEPAKDGQRIKMGGNGKKVDAPASNSEPKHDPVTGEVPMTDEEKRAAAAAEREPGADG
jgi:hypothetical protein